MIEIRKFILLFGIVFVIICSLLISPVSGNIVNEDYKELELNRKILLVIGGVINICWAEKELYGFGIIIYTNGNTSYMTNYTIKFEGIPLFINNLFLIGFCFYKPA